MLVFKQLFTFLKACLSIFNALYCLLFRLLNWKSMFAALHSDINSIKSGLIYLTGPPNSPKGRAGKDKNGIISATKLLGTISVDRYNIWWLCWLSLMLKLAMTSNLMSVIMLNVVAPWLLWIRNKCYKSFFYL
jgi:hypothetical protein